jgi:hypothetical protein
VALELQTAKEILAEMFHVRPADVEEMLQRRLEERSWLEEREKEVSVRWLKASRALKKEDQFYGQKLAEMAKKSEIE